MKRRLAFILAAAFELAACSPHKPAEDAVKAILSDPDSAKFSSEIDGQNGNVCGLVNAKNKLGGYVGQTPFFYEKISQQASIVSPVQDSDFRSLWLTMSVNSSSFKDEYSKLATMCSLVARWKDVCGVEYPAPKHRLCDPLLAGRPAEFYKAMRTEYN